MGKVISLAHKMIESKFEKQMVLLMKKFNSLDESDPNYASLIEELKNSITDDFLDFKKRILTLGYRDITKVCECKDCSKGVDPDPLSFSL